ncbi:MAG: hypothetical protein WBF17_15405 [Phycisphaerae bacterium]
MDDIDPIFEMRDNLRRLREQAEGRLSKSAKADEITSKASEKAEWLAEEAPKWQAASEEHPEFREIIRGTAAWAQSCGRQVEAAFQAGAAAEAAEDEVLSDLQVVSDIVDSTGGTACTTSVQVFCSDFPDEVQQTYGIRPFAEMPSGASSQRLNELLGDLDPTLVSIRGAAWQALRQRATPDYLRHAASSMRQLLDHLFGKFAPDKEIMQCAWWRPSSASQSLPTKRDKLKYLIYGGSAPEDPNMLDLLQTKISQHYASWCELCSGIHRLEANEAVVESSMQDLDQALQLILDRRRQASR